MLHTGTPFSVAYVTLFTVTITAGLVGYGMTFTAGRGNDTVSMSILFVLQYLLTACRSAVQSKTSPADLLGKTLLLIWERHYLMVDAQLRW